MTDQIIITTPEGSIYPRNPYLITDELAAIGRSASTYNRVLWPAGASKYGSAKFIVAGSDLSASFNNEASARCSLQFGDVTFDRMFIRTPLPIHISGGTGEYYEVELVDERYFLQTIYPQAGIQSVAFNLTTRDKEELYDSTELSDGFPYDVGQLLLVAINASLPVIGSETFIPQIPRAFRDVTAYTTNIGVFIDKLLAMSGHMFIAYPNATYAPDPEGGNNSYRYEVAPNQSGLARLSSQLQTWGGEITSGGFFAGFFDGDTYNLPGGFADRAFGPFRWWASDIPTSIEVSFPRAAKDGVNYSFDQDDIDGTKETYAVRRDHRVTTASGRPSTTGQGLDFIGNGNTKRIFDTTHAIFSGPDDDPDNNAELMARADAAAEAYYSRFLSGVGDCTFRGIRPIVPWAGALMVEWVKTARGAHTRIMGHPSDPAFGFRTDTPLTAADVFSSGAGRAIPRPDNGILLDILETTGAGGNLYLGRITGTTGGTNAFYSAVAVTDSNITVSNEPPRRFVNIANVDVLARGIGDPCFIGVGAGGERYLWVLDEIVATVDCDAAPLNQSRNTNRARALYGGASYV